MEQKNKEYLNSEFVRKRQIILDFISLRVINTTELLKSINISPVFFFSKRKKELVSMKMSHLDKFVAEIAYYRDILRSLIEKDSTNENTVSIVNILNLHNVFLKQIWGKKDARIIYIKAKIAKGANLNDKDISIIFSKMTCLEECMNAFLIDLENTDVSNFTYNVPTYLTMTKISMPPKHNESVFNSSDVIKKNIEDIISRRKKGERIKNIAKSYNVSAAMLSKIITKYNNNTLFPKESAKDKLISDP